MRNSNTTTYVYGTVQNRSDLRDKVINDDAKKLGIDFVLGLNPVQGVWDFRDDYYEEYEVQIGTSENDEPVYETRRRAIDKDGSKKRNRLHQWFIAQEVVALLDKLGIDSDTTGLIQNHAVQGGADVYTLGYDEFIPPVVSAIQSCWKEIEDIKRRLDSLESS